MNFIVIAPNPWLQREARLPLPDLQISTLEAVVNSFLKHHGILLNRIAYRWSDKEGYFSVVNVDNGSLIASCTIKHVVPRV